MHAGAPIQVYLALVMDGDVGAGILHKPVPERNALGGVGWRTLIRKRHVPSHSVRGTSTTLRLIN